MKLVLSGAGARGFGILGGIKLFEEKGIMNEINAYWGTSIGSMIIYLVAMGYTSVEILQKFLHDDVNNVISCDIQHLTDLGLTPIENFTRIIKNISIEKFGSQVPTFKLFYEKYKKKLNIIATNVTQAKCTVFNLETEPDMSIIEAIELSCSLPAIFTKKYYKNDWYVDGGFSNNYAIDLAEAAGGDDKIYGIYVNPATDCLLGGNNTIGLLYNLLSIPLLELNNHKLKKCSNRVINIELNINNISLTCFYPLKQKKIEVFSLGYNQTKYMYEKIIDPYGWNIDF